MNAKLKQLRNKYPKALCLIENGDFAFFSVFDCCLEDYDIFAIFNTDWGLSSLIVEITGIFNSDKVKNLLQSVKHINDLRIY